MSTIWPRAIEDGATLCRSPMPPPVWPGMVPPVGTPFEVGAGSGGAEAVGVAYWLAELETPSIIADLSILETWTYDVPDGVNERLADRVNTGLP